MAVWYDQPPVQLATLAPLPFTVAGDPVARRILVEASRALADLVDAVRVPDLAGPVVVGGSVIAQGILGAAPDLRADLAPIGGGAELVPVTDGVLGAAVLALRAADVDVDAAAFDRLRAGVEAARRGHAPTSTA
jgi:N-acetylglucosamine kinase-like BadF-type ATPase